MANNYYNNDSNIILPGTTADASDVENKCDDIAAGMDAVQVDTDNALKLTAADNTIRSISDLAAVRANKNLGFNADGDLTLNVRGGTYKSNWTTATFYFQDDTIKDTVGTAGYGVDAILVCLVTHTSTNLTADAANWDVFISTSDLEQAVTDAQTAETGAQLAETNAQSSEDDAELSQWEAEAEALTADSYATQTEDVFVDVYTSDGDGTFTAIPTTDYSALHWAAKAAASDPNLKVNRAGDIITDNLVLDNSSDASILLDLRNSNGSLSLVTQVTTGNASIQQLASSGVFEKTWINLIRNGGIFLTHNGSTKIETTSTGATVTGAIAGSVAPTSLNHLTRKDYVDAAVASVPVPIPSGTKMVFYQASAPTGWTQDTTKNDFMLRSVTGVGGGSGGIRSPVTTHTHTTSSLTLSAAQMPSHSHSYSRYTAVTTNSSGASANTWNGVGTYNTGSTGGGSSHTHGNTSTASGVRYINVILASKN